MAAFTTFLGGIPVSALPERYRTRLGVKGGDIVAAATVSGALQTFIFLFLLTFRYPALFERNVQESGESIVRGLGSAALASDNVQWGLGFSATVESVFHPMTLVLLYFVLEGLFRTLAAGAAGEVVGTLPLGLVATVHGRVGRAFRSNAFGRWVPDEVSTGTEGHDLTVRSCRPKPSWNRNIAIRHANQLYQIVEETAGPRPFVWHLREYPPCDLVRTAVDYPDEGIGPRKPWPVTH
jgi:hypothetical protein